ncbi:MAG: substrate-binding domain-containing protein [Flexilinea sp.]|jgi:ribose transport system substrate-binding protein
MKKVFAIIIALSLIIGMAGFEEAPREQIGVILSTLNNPFFIHMKEQIELKAEELGYDVIVLDTADNPTQEMTNMEDLISKQVSGIILNAVDSDASANCIKLANEANIPVVEVDRFVNSGDMVAQLVSDNYGGGKLAGEYAAKVLNGKGNVVILRGYIGITTDNERYSGFVDVIKQYPDIKIISEQAADFDRTKGFEAMENILQAEDDITLVYALNDEMALGVVKAIEAANREGIMVIGFDGAQDGVDAIKEGKMTATVAQQFGLMGRTAVEYLDQKFRGTLEEITEDVTRVPVSIVDYDIAQDFVLN